MVCWQPFGRPGAAGVHQEQRRLGGHGDRLDGLPGVFGEHLVEEEVPAVDHRGRRGVLAGVAPPDEHLVDVLSLLGRLLEGLVGLDLMVGQLAGAVVAVHGDQDVAARVGDPTPAGGAAEAAEHLRVDDAQPGTGQHGDGQFGDHRQVQRHPVAGLKAGEVAQQGGDLVHLPKQLRIAEVHGLVGLELGHEDDRGLVRSGRGVPVDAVVRGVQPAADEPLEERRGARIQRRVPGLIPGQQVGVLLEAVGELVLGEPLPDGRIAGVGLRDERRRRREHSSSRQCTAICASETSAPDPPGPRPSSAMTMPSCLMCTESAECCAKRP